MASHLSFADRENLLETISRLSGEANDVSLLHKTGEWARELEPRFGFEQALLRNLTQLANYLRLHHATEDIASIARGAIQFIVANHGQPEECGDQSKDSDQEIEEFRVLGQAFVASYAVHEIAIRLHEPVAYHPPAITKEEQTLAEEIFERLSAIDGCDMKLVDRVVKNLDNLTNLTDCGFLKRMATNARTLIGVLQDENRPTDDKTCARGALRYFVEDDDAINDELGLLGYLDDIFILQTAVDLVSPLREPLIELLDHVVGVWPFLNMLTLDDGTGPRAASEFAILNSALACRDLRSADTLNTMLIAPETGPIAILLGFISTLGLAHEAGIRQLTEDSFSPGQKVLVDYEAVAEFDGFFTTPDGRRMFRLMSYYIARGERCRSPRDWPVSDLHRLVPVDYSRSIRGEIERSKRNQITGLSGLSFLFNGPNKADVHAIRKQVIVVMPTTLAAEFCKTTSLYGQPIKDVIPVGQVSADGEASEPWSTRFGTQKPVLLFASDLDIARTYAEEYREDIELIIVDVAGRNREKHASLKRLNRLKIPCLLIATERIANETKVDRHNDLSVWEWGTEDLQALVWPESQLTSDAGDIARFEHRVRATSSAQPVVESITLPVVGEAYSSFRRLRRLAKQRGPDGLHELDEIVAEAFFAMTRLMRCSTELEDDSACVVEVGKRLARINELANGSNFISDDERATAERCAEKISEFVGQLRETNPKAEALAQILAKHPDADILCPDARLIADLEATFARKPPRVLATVNDGDAFDNGLIVTGWFRQSRMASILSPPIANPVVLLLYDVERRWHQQFLEKRTTMREERTRLKSRATIFPTMSGWKSPRPLAETTVDVQPEVEDIEEVRSEINHGFRQRIYAKVRSGESDTDVKARLVVFAGGVYGLFTDNYKLNVVTHLLDESLVGDEEKASVKLSSAKEVAVGDAIVFRPKSRDLIREVADEMLEPGQRQMSSLWQRALRKYINQSGLSVDVLCSKLRAAGCKSQNQAMHNWIKDDDMIAPQQYRSDVPAIAQVTGDLELSNSIDAVVDAIKHVRSAHQQKAPRVIAKRIRRRAATVVRQEQNDQSIVHLAGDLVLVRVAEPASELIPIRYTSANRLIEGDTWHE